MTDLHPVGRFVPEPAVMDGTLVVFDDQMLVWAGDARFVPLRILEGGEAATRRLLVNPAYLARLNAAMALRGEGEPCPHTEVRPVASPTPDKAWECVACGARLAAKGASPEFRQEKPDGDR